MIDIDLNLAKSLLFMYLQGYGRNENRFVIALKAANIK